MLARTRAPRLFACVLIATALTSASPAQACTGVGILRVNCPDEPEATPSPAPVATRPTAGEALDLLNEDRERAGKPLLGLSPAASRVAARHAKAMATRGRVYHNTSIASSRGRRSLGSPRRVAENVGAGPSLRAVQAGLMDSPRHRRNVLASWTSVGIGVHEVDGVVFVVQVFLRGGAKPVKVVPSEAPIPSPTPEAASLAMEVAEPRRTSSSEDGPAIPIGVAVAGVAGGVAAWIRRVSLRNAAARTTASRPGGS